MRLYLPGAKVVSVVLLSSALLLALTAWGWGSASGLLEHPARLAACVVVIVSTIVMLFSGVTLDDSANEQVRTRWIALLFIVFSMVLAWLQAYADRRDLATLDGDATRYIGLALLVVGTVLRVGPMFALGNRFRVPWANQQEHRLVTTGFYRFIRNPSYLGAIVGAVGWTLVFRGALFIVVYLLLLPVLTVTVLRREEAMLQSEFGDLYRDYKKRSVADDPLRLLKADSQG